MSVSIGGRQVEQKAVRKSYQVEVAATATTMTLAHSHFTALDGQFRNVIKFISTLRN